MNPGRDGLAHYQRLFGPKPHSLDHSSLPAPAHYLAERGLLMRKPRGEWTQIRCPAHKRGDERNPSMSVSLVDGHFRCHACGASGGDVLALHRLVTGLGFRESVVDLGGRFYE
jgi:CHC2-type zinc finger protein